MKAIFQEVKKLNQCYGTPPPGQFALEVEPPKSPHWDHCREQFLGKMSLEMIGFYFSTPIGKIESVAEFLVKFEEVVGLDPKSSFRQTEKQTILWVEQSSFWMNCILKKSLLTLILRCGINYDIEKDNFEEVLFSDVFLENKYARETKNALKRFMYGFTKFHGIVPNNPPISWDGSSTLMKHGWHAEFENAEIQTVRRKLRSENENYEPILIGIESLWS